ncbi:catalase-peroxidase [Fragilaria crotonensis]|nr:catalase-peroxidase [Fragilaria crotonensis]
MDISTIYFVTIGSRPKVLPVLHSGFRPQRLPRLWSLMLMTRSSDMHQSCSRLIWHSVSIPYTGLSASAFMRIPINLPPPLPRHGLSSLIVIWDHCLDTSVPEVPREVLLWQDPIPNKQYFLPERDVVLLKRMILDSGLSIPQLVRVAWASACTYRRTDHRGGANGGRIRLPPQINWPVNKPEELEHVLRILQRVRRDFGKEVSIADLIVLGGCAAIESAAKRAGHVVQVPFSSGRTDASLEETDVESFAFLEPTSDGFRNYMSPDVGRPSEELLVDRAQMLGLTAPEMTVLVGGMRVLNTSHDIGLGVLTSEPSTLSNDFFVNLLHMNTIWKPTKDKNVFEGYDFSTNKLVWKASRVDLIFGSNSELRAIAEYYACDDSRQVFVQDFVKVWNKVMNADRFDLKEMKQRSKL